MPQRTRADGRYRAFTAQERTNGRRSRSRRNSRFGEEDFALVNELLRRQWSPEQVSGHLARSGLLWISHETIYRHIWRDKKAGGLLYTHLRGARKRRRKHYGAYDSRGRLSGKRMISERPPEVQARSHVGHWEADTVAGTGARDCVVTLVERKTGLVLIGKLADRTAASLTRRAISLMRRGGARFETVTADNGTEFHDYKRIEERTGAAFYFARGRAGAGPLRRGPPLGGAESGGGSVSLKERSRKAAAVAELAAGVRSEPARLAQIERFRRHQDEPARRHHANGIRALRCYVEACGYDFETAHPVLSAAIAAAGGADHEVTRPDWLMGLYLRGGTAEEAARLGELPSRAREKLALARAWKRAFEAFQAEQERAGIVSLRRTHGTIRGGRRHASTLHALCAQDLAEIERSPARKGRRRFEGFAVAAHAQVEFIRRDPSRFCRPTPRPDPKPRFERADPPPASRRVVFLAKLDRLTSDLLAAEVSGGATEAELDELRAAAHARIEELFADALGGDAGAVLSTSLKESSSGQNAAGAAAAAAQSSAALLSATRQKPLGKRRIDPGLADTSVHQTADEDDLPGEDEMRERIAVLVEAGEMDEETARDFEASAHDPLTRSLFAHRYMGGSRRGDETPSAG